MNDAMRPDQETSTAQRAFHGLRQSLRTRIIGQEALVDRLLIALLADGHLLVEGAPGLAKTTAVKELAARIEGEFHRVQFTPDLLPADLTGTEIYRPENASFVFQRGPLFHNVLLADEVNRAPAKVQSALLEAMGERQITVGRTTYELPPLFLVMATQNPIEQEGTYPLPEAQLDRFLLFVRIDYPSGDAEQAILRLVRQEACSRAGERNRAGEVTRVEASVIFDARRGSPRHAPVGAARALPRGARACNPHAGALRRRSRALDRVRGESARQHRARSMRPRPCMAGRARLRSPS